jgi:hypothetical protein
MLHNFDVNFESDTDEDNNPELLKQTEELYFLLSHNLTREAKSIIWDFLRLAKVYYPKSNHKRSWNQMLKNLQAVIDDFENQFSENSVVTLYGIQQNARDLNDSDKIDHEPPSEDTETKDKI